MVMYIFSFAKTFHSANEMMLFKWIIQEKSLIDMFF